jgi:guanylate kinase
MQRSGILFVVSAPSGAGKTTLCNNLHETPDFHYSVSCTTRPPRKGEEDGKDYWFMDEKTFMQRIEQGYFLEHARVHGHSYGTPIQAIRDTLVRGLDLLLVIDVQGARQIRSNPDPAICSALVDVFLMPPTFAELERRLRKRASDDEETIRLRLTTAHSEMSHWREYRYAILSSSMEEDLQKFRAIMKAERYRTSRLTLDEV